MWYMELIKVVEHTANILRPTGFDHYQNQKAKTRRKMLKSLTRRLGCGRLLLLPAALRWAAGPGCSFAVVAPHPSAVRLWRYC